MQHGHQKARIATMSTETVQPLRFIKIEDKDVFTHGYLIADENGVPQLHTLRSAPKYAWRAVVDGEITPKRRKELKRMGFRVVRVHVESVDVFKQRGERCQR